MPKTRSSEDIKITLRDVFSMEGLKAAGLAIIPAAGLSLLAYTSLQSTFGDLTSQNQGAGQAVTAEQRCKEAVRDHIERMDGMSTFKQADVEKLCPTPEPPRPPWYVVF